ncbi:MAG: alpha/beta hydrolase [Bacteroidota bacterium]
MKRASKLLLIILSPYIIIVLGLYLAQQRLIFLPGKLPADYDHSFQRSFEELFIETEDGAVLNALHFKADNAKGLVVYYHGNAGDLSGWGYVANGFPDYDVLMLDYRCYGKSTGEISEAALYSDAELFYEEAKKLFPESSIIVYGRSLGATFAAYAAARHTPAKLVLETPFYNLTDIVKSQYWFLPVDLLLRFKFPTSEFIGAVKCPVTVIHGTDDQVVSYESGQKLFNAVKAEKEFVTIPDGGHNNLGQFEEYHQAIERVF